MTGTVQEYLAHATKKAGDALIVAFDRIPEDKQNWSPMGARSAVDQLAECAMLSGGAGDIISGKLDMKNFDFAKFQQAKTELCQDVNALKELVQTNVGLAVKTIEETQSSDLDKMHDMPWGPINTQDLIGYAYWNLSYHEGQINYIASMLEKQS